MKLIIGLGNPGERYQKNRHNIGFLMVDALVEKISNFHFPITNWENNGGAKAICCLARVGGRKIQFIKPQTFMNNSGRSVLYAYKKNSVKPNDLCVIHDDLDIKLGEYKIQKGVGPKVHNGVESVEKHLRTKDFWRVRFGIDNSETRNKINAGRVRGEDYVLQDFESGEEVVLRETISRATDSLFGMLRDGFWA